MRFDKKFSMAKGHFCDINRILRANLKTLTIIVIISKYKLKKHVVMCFDKKFSAAKGHFRDTNLVRCML